MNATRTLASATVLALVIASGASQAASITIVADEWCPYNCEPDSDKPGYMIEIARKVLGQAGHSIDYRTLPWSRAIAETRLGKFDAVVGATPGDAEDFVFPENMLGKSSNVFWVNHGEAWKFTGMASLDKISLGTIRDYSYGDQLDAYVSKYERDAKRVQIASGDDALDTNFKKLSAKRITALIEDRNVAEYQIAGNGQNGKFLAAGDLGVDPIYIAFSPASPNAKQYAQLLSEGIDKLRASGELATILKKYGLSDWK